MEAERRVSWHEMWDRHLEWLFCALALHPAFSCYHEEYIEAERILAATFRIGSMIKMLDTHFCEFDTQAGEKPKPSIMTSRLFPPSS